MLFYIKFFFIFPNSIAILKAINFLKIQSNSISITHWQHDINSLLSTCYPLPSITCKPYQGYSLNSFCIFNYCILEVFSILSTQFFGRKSNNQLKLNANYIDLIHSTNFKNPLEILSLSSINIVDSLTSFLFYNNIASNNLFQIALANQPY